MVSPRQPLGTQIFKPWRSEKNDPPFQKAGYGPECGEQTYWNIAIKPMPRRVGSNEFESTEHDWASVTTALSMKTSGWSASDSWLTITLSSCCWLPAWRRTSTFTLPLERSPSRSSTTPYQRTFTTTVIEQNQRLLQEYIVGAIRNVKYATSAPQISLRFLRCVNLTDWLIDIVMVKSS